jgi:hypothetical protein
METHCNRSMSSSSNPNALNERIFSLLSNVFPLFDKENIIRHIAGESQVFPQLDPGS